MVRLSDNHAVPPEFFSSEETSVKLFLLDGDGAEAGLEMMQLVSLAGRERWNDVNVWLIRWKGEKNRDSDIFIWEKTWVFLKKGGLSWHKTKNHVRTMYFVISSPNSNLFQVPEVSYISLLLSYFTT